MNENNRNKFAFEHINLMADRVAKEVTTALDLLKSIDKPIVTIYGSHRPEPGNEHFDHAYKTAYELGKAGYAILTGGGSGIMRAANKGATDAGAPSIGCRVELLKSEWVGDVKFSHELVFHFLFVRRFAMSIKANALVYYPGAFGTLNELFENATLMSANIIDKMPMICVNRKYWDDLFEWIKNHPLENNFMAHGQADLNMICFAESTQDILDKVKNCNK